MQALALRQALFLRVALVEADIIENALIFAAIERAKDCFAAFQILAAKDCERVLIKLLRAFKDGREGCASFCKLVRRFRLDRGEAIARDAVNVLRTERDGPGLNLLGRT